MEARERRAKEDVHGAVFPDCLRGRERERDRKTDR